MYPFHEMIFNRWNLQKKADTRCTEYFVDGLSLVVADNILMRTLIYFTSTALLYISCSDCPDTQAAFNLLTCSWLKLLCQIFRCENTLTYEVFQVAIYNNNPGSLKKQEALFFCWHWQLWSPYSPSSLLLTRSLCSTKSQLQINLHSFTLKKMVHSYYSTFVFNI